MGINREDLKVDWFVVEHRIGNDVNTYKFREYSDARKKLISLNHPDDPLWFIKAMMRGDLLIFADELDITPELLDETERNCGLQIQEKITIRCYGCKRKIVTTQAKINRSRRNYYKGRWRELDIGKSSIHCSECSERIEDILESNFQ